MAIISYPVQASGFMVPSTDIEKRSAATGALKFVKDNSTIGLGTGTTTHYFILGLAELVKQGINVKCMASSIDTARKAESLGITVIDTYPDKLDAYFDGADEVEPGGSLIKGGGGALTREKSGRIRIQKLKDWCFRLIPTYLTHFTAEGSWSGLTTSLP